MFLALALAPGCARIDQVDERTTTMNLAISEAENNAILLNVVRSSLSEPLSFSALASFQGHQTLTGMLTAPTFGAADTPLRLSSIQTPGNSSGGTISNDFSYTAFDDNATYAALLQPINPATVGYFLKQDYPRELLFFLLVSKIRILRSGAAPVELRNEGVIPSLGPKPFEAFGTALQSLIDSGLTAQVDLTPPIRAKLCFDRDLDRLFRSDPDVHRYDFAETCPQAPIYTFETSGSKDAKPPVPKRSFADVYSFVIPSRDKARGGSSTITYEVTLRSAFGVYRYLGKLIENKTDLPILKDPAERDRLILTLTNGTQDCFVRQNYRGVNYCVPNEATTTKRVFSFLHDLVKLYTFPTAQPQTLTARLIGG